MITFSLFSPAVSFPLVTQTFSDALRCEADGSITQRRLIMRIVAGENASAGAVGKRSPPTKTVYGFLDFTTTVSDTVMIFKPSKSAGNCLIEFSLSCCSRN